MNIFPKWSWYSCFPPNITHSVLAYNLALSYYTDRAGILVFIETLWVHSSGCLQGMSIHQRGLEKRKASQEYRKEYRMEVEDSYEESGRSVEFTHIMATLVSLP